MGCELDSVEKRRSNEGCCGANLESYSFMGIIVLRGSPNKKLLKNDFGSVESKGEATEGRFTAFEAAMMGSDDIESCNGLLPRGTDDTRRPLMGCPIGAIGVMDRLDDALGSNGNDTRLLKMPSMEGDELSDKEDGEVWWSMGDAFSREEDDDVPCRISRWEGMNGGGGGRMGAALTG